MALRKQDNGFYLCPACGTFIDTADNMVADLAELQHLSPLHSLSHILLHGNVFGHTAKACGFTYRPLVIALLPPVEAVDDQVTPTHLRAIGTRWRPHISHPSNDR